MGLWLHFQCIDMHASSSSHPDYDDAINMVDVQPTMHVRQRRVTRVQPNAAVARRWRWRTKLINFAYKHERSSQTKQHKIPTQCRDLQWEGFVLPPQRVNLSDTCNSRELNYQETQLKHITAHIHIHTHYKCKKKMSIHM
jgi:hypothetical protein